MIFKLSDIKTAVIMGGGHGIGLALTKRLLSMNPNTHIFVSYRDENKAQELVNLGREYRERLHVYQLDPIDESGLEHFVEQIKLQNTELDLCINAIGTLHDELAKPEKSLRDIDSQTLLHYFKVNSVITPLLAKHFFPLLKHKKPAIFAAISAKVGSIQDNRMGGWYGYRASKAALNMFLKNIALEFQRRNANTLVLALHPGTTVTELSKPFIAKTKYTLHTPEQTADNLLAVMNEQDIFSDKHFLSWDQTELPW
jgi:NAD(P)-dependent dehydrogenase (short-subunit alcohol dehydrogenase family)